MTDIEIAGKAHLRDIKDIAESIGLNKEDIVLYGQDKAKIIKEKGNKTGKLVLVTAINPTPFGEGKTTVSIGLADALKKLNKDVVVVLRQPSMGPVFGLKGGATGGGYSQVMPMTDINLHFTGDFHAITSANNLLSAAIDNHIYRGNELKIKYITFNRCLDVNDRNLRDIKINERNYSFDITAASEIMAILTLAKDFKDLKERLGNIVIGYNEDNKLVYAKELGIEDSLTVILKDAFYPNLVQTLENTPAIIHGGPFANIAHGCNSIKATKLALSLSDYVITEAGFGSDLGAEKFFDIKCRYADIKPDCVVLVTTIKALKYNDATGHNDLEKGMCNLTAHINNLKKSNSNILVCINKYDNDTDEEIKLVEKECEKNQVTCTISSAYSDGGEGATNLAEKVLHSMEKENKFNYLYDINDSIEEKILKLTNNIYNASSVEYSKEALEKIKLLKEQGKEKLPICIAKTQYSLSDDPKKLGYPSNYTINVRDIKLFNGAGFITVFLGKILTMPGLPKEPNYKKIKLDNNRKIKGIS